MTAVRPVADDQWPIVAWLWQAFRNDLVPVVHSYPRPDGRYKHDHLDGYPGDDRAGYLAWDLHPQLGELAPVGFALVDGIGGARRSLAALHVVPAARRGGLGRALALDVIARHEGPWDIAFQHGNEGAGHFWRRVAEAAFGPEGSAWTEEERPVPGRPDVPPDHWISTS